MKDKTRIVNNLKKLEEYIRKSTDNKLLEETHPYAISDAIDLIGDNPDTCPQCNEVKKLYNIK